MRIKKWFWGIFFICAAILIVGIPMGLGEGLSGISTLDIILTILLAAVIIENIIHLNFYGITFPAALILWIYSSILGIPGNIVPWGLLAAALFLAIGLSIIFKRKNNWWNHGPFNHEHRNTTVIENSDENDVNFNVNFGAGSKYLNSDSLRKAYFKCSFGALQVYFDNAKLSPDGADVYLDCSFSGVELYIPRSWKVENNIEAILGGVEEKVKTKVIDGPALRLNGRVSLGGIEIIYI